MLTACAGSNLGPVDGPLIAGAGALADPCETPVELPNRALTQAEVETLWRQDRANLLSCGERLISLAEFVRQRDIELSGAQ